MTTIFLPKKKKKTHKFQIEIGERNFFFFDIFFVYLTKKNEQAIPFSRVGCFIFVSKKRKKRKEQNPVRNSLFTHCYLVFFNFFFFFF